VYLCSPKPNLPPTGSEKERYQVRKHMESQKTKANSLKSIPSYSYSTAVLPYCLEETKAIELISDFLHCWE